MTPRKGKAQSLVEPLEVKEAKLAADAEPGSSAKGNSGSDPNEQQPDETKNSWIEIKLVDESGAPVPGERFRITMGEGKTRSGTLDHEGFVRIEGIDPGTYDIAFPRLDGEAWEAA